MGGRDAFGRVGQIKEGACGAPGQLQKSGTPSRILSREGRSSEESADFPEGDVCLSQARPSSEQPPDGVPDSNAIEVVPETMPGCEAAVQEIASTAVPVQENVVEPMSDDDDQDLPEAAEDVQAANDGAGSDIFNDAEENTEQELLMQNTQDMAPKKTATQLSLEPMRTSRIAALRNRMCPSPLVSPVAAPELGLPSRVKKGPTGRGRAAQGGTRGEKKFKAPGVVGETSKGRGRGGKVAKRKRDMNSQ